MFKLLTILFLSFLCLIPTGCGETRKVVKELKRPPIETNLINNKEVVKIIKDTSDQMAWFKFIGILLMGLGVGAVCMSFVWPFVSVLLKGAGAGLVGIGSTFFIVSLGTQIVLPWLPYFLFFALVALFAGVAVYVIRRVDWTPDEIDAVKKLNADEPNADQHPIIKEILSRVKV